MTWKRIEHIRKAVVAFFASGAGVVVVQVVSESDFSTADGAKAAAVALVVGIVTYSTRNKPKRLR